PYLEPLAHVRPVELSDGRDASQRGQLMTAVRLGTAWLGGGEDASGGAALRDAAVVEVRAAIERVRGLLGTASFVERAPREVVARERARLAELEARLRRLEGG
ncbi:MAG: hypothetical protein ACRDFY_03460, partial [Candidatus Limnocylindria bacterium]